MTTTDKRTAESDLTIPTENIKRLKVTTTTNVAHHAGLINTYPEDTKEATTAAAAPADALPKNECIVGRPAPTFSVPAVMEDGSISTVSLDQFKDRYLVLVFYPADFTFVCPTEITSFSDQASRFASLNCSVVVCSTDSEFVHYNWRQQARKDGGIGQIVVPMLADRTRTMSHSYGVLCEESGQAFRGLFVIDGKQVVRIAQVNDMPIGRSVDETLRLVSALKHTDEHGQVCPANWRAGDAAIEPEIQKSKAFFKA
ncbi:Peroxiredoxin-2 [Coemansia aciculifera]|uniref:Peroxiredoxin-2 n=1 Tax=Coemansia aciculifera TaxID=417176 RepID=A0ACC1M746_9FUNG|nr:Peroxiredoxin-2 [Coemansia aciculifera]